MTHGASIYVIFTLKKKLFAPESQSNFEIKVCFSKEMESSFLQRKKNIFPYGESNWRQVERVSGYPGYLLDNPESW